MYKFSIMKKFLLLMSLGVVMASFTVQSDVSEIVNALKSANAESVSGYFDSYIDLTLPGKSSVIAFTNIFIQSFCNQVV
ncbi:hypothetical protein AH06_00815 [candidate division TM6 bacterium Zodletone_IIa]|nr:hypothetical protein AH06_00815 [candidate division TM6 bacterium Zodletone_IIa]